MQTRTALIACTLLALSTLACGGKDGAEAGGSKQPSTKSKADAPDEAEAPDEAKPEQGPPSNEPARTFTQLWASPTGQATGSVAAVRDGRVYAIAGEHMEMGTPATQVLALSLDSGEQQWSYTGKEPLELERISDKLLELSTMGGGRVVLSADAGKETTPSKADSEATAELPQADPGTCEIDGAKLRCEGWSEVVEASGAISRLQKIDARVCYAVAGKRELRCRAADTGDLEFVIAVPAVPGVKDPEAVNFSVHVVGDRVVIGNYDGTVLAYGPA